MFSLDLTLKMMSYFLGNFLHILMLALPTVNEQEILRNVAYGGAEVNKA